MAAEDRFRLDFALAEPFQVNPKVPGPLLAVIHQVNLYMVSVLGQVAGHGQAISPIVTRAAENVYPDRGALQAAGGDDYELCCCLAPDQVGEAVIALAALNLPLTVIGRVGAGKGAVQLMAADGTPVVLPADGYDHFSS